MRRFSFGNLKDREKPGSKNMYPLIVGSSASLLAILHSFLSWRIDEQKLSGEKDQNSRS